MVLIYFILFYYCFLGACLFSRERQKDYGSRWEGRCWGTGRSRGRRKPTQNILDENNLFAIKEKTIANPVTHSFPLVINKNQIDNKVQIKYKMLIMNWNLQVIVIDIFFGLCQARVLWCGTSDFWNMFTFEIVVLEFLMSLKFIHCVREICIFGKFIVVFVLEATWVGMVMAYLGIFYPSFICKCSMQRHRKLDGISVQTLCCQYYSKFLKKKFFCSYSETVD